VTLFTFVHSRILIQGTPCPIYQCALNPLNPSDIKDINNKICASHTLRNLQEYVDLEECNSEDHSCAHGAKLPLGKTTTCQAIPDYKHKQLPGIECSIDSECLSGPCLNGICRGADKGGKCEVDHDCDIDTFCDKQAKRCQYLSHENQHCDENKPCYSWAVCLSNQCVIKFSKLVGESVPDHDKNHLACETAYTKADEQGIKCTLGPKLQGAVHRNWKNLTCKYYAGNDVQPDAATIPVCGYSNVGSFYCPLGIGDLYDRMQDLKAFMQKMPKCHIDDHRFECKEAKLLPERKRAIAALWFTEGLTNGISTASSYIEDNDECVKEMITYDFWNFNDRTLESKNGSSITAATLLGFALCLIFSLL